MDENGYNHIECENRWQKKWADDRMYESNIDLSRPKYYALTMLPYPSGDLHIGHWYAMTPSDARARFMRMRGYNVLFPMGFDAFGLPAENAAIKRGVHPKLWTYANIERMRAQLKTMGAMFDWRRETASADPKYYRWSQWFFTQLYKNDLAYRKMSPVDWCPNCNTTLAREQVWGEDRHCERCGTPVIKKNLEQWFFRTTRYADQLLDFSSADWPERVRTLQTNWIGRSEGAAVTFNTENGDQLDVFTTRTDTLWGATFMVLAPEHPLVTKLTSAGQKEAVEEYILQTSRQSDIQREAAEKEKTGIFTGGYAINPVNNRRIPVWIADYVLMSYGTGAIMAVPAHDERDFSFALKFGLPIIPVIANPEGIVKSFVPIHNVDAGFADSLNSGKFSFQITPEGWQVVLTAENSARFIEIARQHVRPGAWIEVVGGSWVFIFEDLLIVWDTVEADQGILARCQYLKPRNQEFMTVMEMLWEREWYRDVLYHSQYGSMIHSGEFSGTNAETAKQQIIHWLEQQEIGHRMVNYRLRDWLISRQRYWGAPFPIVYCPEHGAVSVPDDQLPVLLPDDVEWRPTGESPLKLHPTWKLTTCPVCGGPAERETDTMDTFMCSSWYHLRYLCPDCSEWPFDQQEYDYWMPVDIYTGGIEHATMHLIYTRFFHKAGRDMGIMKGDEPMLRLFNQGIILGEDSEKMSKSRGNVIAPDDLVNRYGSDTVRAYLMFFARWDMGGPWNSGGIEGTARWIKRVWALFTDRGQPGRANPEDRRKLRRKLHQTLRRVTHDYESLEFNTIISSLMELLNEMYKGRELGLVGMPEWDEALNFYLLMMAPACPHITEELWSRRGKPYSIHQQAWPTLDEEAAMEDLITLVVQINGKVRDRIIVPVGTPEEELKKLALESVAVQKHLEGEAPKKVIVIPGRLVNIVV